MGDSTTPIAIIGLGGRFPGEATDPSKLWDMCFHGEDAWTEVPSSRFNHKAFYHPDMSRNGATNVKGGFFLKEDLAHFDAAFFGMTKLEAAALDPQQRLLLECCYETFENAGASLDQVAGTDVGVFVGSFCSDWSKITLRDPDAIPMYHATGSGQAMLSNRLSYFFDLHGPSLTLDTACSASLVALHLACQAIKAGECGSALVGGVNCLICHDSLGSMSSMGFLSPDGRSHTYDARANGYGRGEGVACVLLKRLDKALEDGDIIRAVIRNTAVNQDGKTPGITFPSALAQAALVRKAYEQAGLSPADTTYVEAHGTGTQAGDPVEASALFEAFGHGRTVDSPLVVGCVKTNIGHLEGASGVAGLVKTVLMLENEIILPNVGFQNPNKRIPLHDWKIEVPTETKPWRSLAHSHYLRASINGFGYGGTNAHAIIDSAADYLHSRGLKGYTLNKNLSCGTLMSDGGSSPLSLGKSTPDSPRASPVIIGIGSAADQLDADSAYGSLPRGLKLDSIVGVLDEDALDLNHPRPQYRLFVLSAFDGDAGNLQAERLRSHLLGQSAPDMDRLSYTLAHHRSLLPWKAGIVASSREELCSALEDVQFRGATEKKPAIAFVFTGQGAQWHAMGRELLCFPEFRQSLDLSSTVISQLGADWSVIAELSRDVKTSRINETAISQPLCTILQIALVDLLRSWNIKPTSVVGHSSGEMAAAYAAGLASRSTAVAAAYWRGQACAAPAADGTEAGAMAAVSCSITEACSLINEAQRGRLTIACFNSPSSFTISGDEGGIQELLDTCASRGTTARKLKVGVAYHSHHMLRAADWYRNALADSVVAGSDGEPEILPACDMFSSVTGARVEPGSMESEYWVTNLVSPVQFTAAFTALCLQAMTTPETQDNGPSEKPAGDLVVVELGPHSALAGPILQILQSNPHLSTKVSYLSALSRNEDASRTTLSLAARLLERGAILDLGGVTTAAGIATTEVTAAMETATSTSKTVRLADLPPYAWNHTTSYWAEPRASVRYRHRREARHDLLGAAEARLGPQPREPRWRNWLRPAELPWLRDHRVQSLVVYPAAGYVCMAVEAARQRAKAVGVATEDIDGYELREVVLGQALVVPESSASSGSGEVESLVSLRPLAADAHGGSTVWDEFVVFSCADDEGTWVEHCRGRIAVRMKRAAAGGAGWDGRDAEVRAERQRLDAEKREAMARGCTEPVDIPSLYEHCTNIGLEYGPTFTNLTKARLAPQQVVGTIVLPDVAACMPAHHHSPFVVHPATLDACLHGIMAFRDAIQAAIVPVFFSSIFISESISRTPHDQLDVCIDVHQSGFRSLDVSLMAFEGDESSSGAVSPVLRMEGLRMTSLAGAMSQGAAQDAQGGRLAKTYYQMTWEPDPTLLRAGDFARLCKHIQPPASEAEMARLLDRAAVHMAQDVMARIPPEKVPMLTHKNQKMYAQLRRMIEAARCDPSSASWEGSSDSERAAVLERVESDAGAEGGLAMVIRRYLVDIVRGAVDPVEVLLPGDVLGRYYADNPRMARQYRQAAVYLGLRARANPHLRVLEIGAGTGGATAPLLEALGRGAAARFAEYRVTDISSGFVSAFKARVGGHWGDLVQFGRLDIEKDPASQGFEPGSYDIVIAANVLHATKSISRTLTNVRSLLRTGGSLILVELIRKPSSVVNLFGIFDGWWLSEEEYRKESPLLLEDEWDASLKDTGFSGLDGFVWDTPDPTAHQGTTMISTAVALGETTVPTMPVPLVVTDGDTALPELAALAGALHQEVVGDRPKVVGLAQAAAEPSASQHCIFYHTNPATLAKLGSDTFESIRSLVMKHTSILWITRGAMDGAASPDFNLVSGLLRTLRMELGGSLVHLDLDAEESLASGAMSETVARVYRKSFGVANAVADEQELAERGGMVLLPRYVEAADTCSYVASRTGLLTAETAPVDQPGRALRLKISQPGFLDSLHFDDREEMLVDLADDEIEIEVRAAGLNFRDVMIAMGQIEGNRFGIECSGIVTKVGQAVTTVQVGDRVAGPANGTVATAVRAEAWRVQKMPDDMAFETAASLPIVYCTALHSADLARLGPNDTVLIHAATGGLGQALIQVCRHRGVSTILATVGSEEKKQFLVDTYAIPPEHIFSSRDESFAAGVMQVTGGRGVDVIFNSLASELLKLTWNCIAPFGRFIELGKKDFAINTRLEMAPFEPNVMFAAVDLLAVLRDRPLYAADLWRDVMELVKDGAIKAPEPLTLYGIAEAETAFRDMQGARHIGKLIVVPKANGHAKVMPRRAATVTLRPDASYVLVGGLGGIGRALAARMVDLGARHIIFVTRDGVAMKSVAEDAIRQLRERGVRVAIAKCDVGDKEQLREALASAAFPPVRGVVHLALVMRSALFRDMPLDAWADSVRPKGPGTWNLHELLPRDMDFFVLLSSAVGIIGNAGQAAYGAASTFQDAFAAYRNRLGLPAVTVDLGMISGIGYVAERATLERSLRAQGFDDTPADECLALIESAMASPFGQPSGSAANIVTGLGLGRFTGGDASRPQYREPRFALARRLAMQSELQRRSAEGQGGTAAVKLRDRLRDATSFADLVDIVSTAVIAKLTSLLMIRDEVKVQKTMAHYGMDSLTAVEMRNWVNSDLEASIPVLELLGNHSISGLCENIARQTRLAAKSTTVEEEPAET